jgi:hypothetical protein
MTVGMIMQKFAYTPLQDAYLCLQAERLGGTLLNPFHLELLFKGN